MGFLDGDVENGLDALFDFNRDGKLDAFERAAEFEFLENDGDFDSDGDGDIDEDDLALAEDRATYEDEEDYEDDVDAWEDDL